MQDLKVNLGNNSYYIHIEESFASLKKIIIDKNPLRVMIITDTNLDKIYTNELISKINDPNYSIYKTVLKAGEENKNIESITKIYHDLKKEKFERKDLILALGGGVIGDMAGFAASTYLRGIPFIQVPTTIIAQCDSSVGGKTGIDFEGGKNLVGAFYQPTCVYINLKTLLSLPKREYVSGFAEVIKHAIILDSNFFEYIGKSMDGIKNLQMDVLKHIITENCRIKASVVEKDEKEQGLRAILNFGHTVGHAIETTFNFKLTHGECVALGMVAVAYMAEKLNIIDENTIISIINAIEKLGLPVSCEKKNINEIYETMFLDKKMNGGKIKFVLPLKIGKAEINKELEKDIIFYGIDKILR